MEPFSIQCDSCQAKLKVAKASLIGKQLPCPKCKSPVLVPAEPHLHPQEFATPPTEDDFGLAEVGFEDVDALLANANLEREHEHVHTRQPEPVRPVQTPLPPTDRPISPTEQSWENPAVTQTRRALGWTAGAIGALLFAGVGAYHLWWNQPIAVAPAKPVAKAETEATIIDDRADINTSPDKEIPAPPVPPHTTKSEKTKPHQETPTTIVDATPPPFEPRKPPAIPPAQPVERPSFASPVTNAPPQRKPNTTTEPTSPRAAPLTDSILQPVAPAKSALSELASLLEESGSSIGTITDATAAVAAAETIGVPKYYFQSAGVNSVNLERQLSQPCAGLHYNNVPLIEIFRDITTISGIPITIDAKSLAGTTDGRLIPSVKVNVTNTDFLDAIETCAATAGWTSSVTENGVLISHPNAESITSTSIDISSLAPLSQQALDGMVDAIKTMIAGESWLTDSDKFHLSREGMSLTIKHTPSVQRKIRQFVRKTAAGIQLSSGKAANRQALIDTLKTRLARAKDHLETSCELKMTAHGTIDDLLQRIRDKTNVDVIANWETLASLGWAPSAKAPGNASEPTLEQMLRQLEQSTKSAAVIIDANTVDLTSPLDATTRGYVEFYWISDLIEKNFTPQRTLQLAQKSIENAHIRAPATIIYEPSCRCIILAAPQSMHRIVEAVLQQLKQLN